MFSSPAYGQEFLWFINITEPQTVNRGAVMPGMLVKHKDGTWTASANLRGRLYLHRGIERTYTRDLLVEVFLDGRGNGLNH